MFAKTLCALTLGLAALLPGLVRAEDGLQPSGQVAAVPALTPVRLEILADLGSKTSKTGETFPLRLAQPILINGNEVVAAGAAGMGEVVWAKKSGGSGSSGELVLAARWLDVNGVRVRLRSMHLALAGEDRMGTVNTLNVATAATVPAVSLIGFFITGRQTAVPKGTLADAKTAEPFVPGAPALPNDKALQGSGTVPRAELEGEQQK